MDEKEEIIRREICDREGILNPDGYENHHCFLRSEYKKPDWNDSWNRDPVLWKLHYSIHHEGNRKLEVYYKKRALARYTGPYRAELEAILRRKSYGI